MPHIEPSRGDVHVNRPLTNISIAFLQNADHFVAARVFPEIPSDKRSNLYFTYNRGDFNRDEMEERAPGAESAGGTYSIGQDNFFCRVRAFHRDIPDQIRSNADQPLNQDREATEFVTHKALIKREVLWAAQYFQALNPGDIWTFDVDGAAAASVAFDPTSAANNDKVFWNRANSTPIEDVRQGKRFVLENTGFIPNVLTLGRATFDTLVDHPDIVGRLDRGQTTGPAMANRAALAALFEVEEITVMDGIQNTAAKGQSSVHSFIGGRHALLSYRPATPGVMTPSAGYTFTWTGFLGATTNGMRIKRIRGDLIESDRIEIDAAYDQKKVSADLGYIFGDIVEA